MSEIKISLNPKDLKELLALLEDASADDDMDGIAVLHAVASIHTEFIETGLMEGILKSMDEIGMLPGPQPLEAWVGAFRVCTSPKGLSALCFAMNNLANMFVNNQAEKNKMTAEKMKEAMKNLRPEEIN